MLMNVNDGFGVNVELEVSSKLNMESYGNFRKEK